jgi:hypothetical protein
MLQTPGKNTYGVLADVDIEAEKPRGRKARQHSRHRSRSTACRAVLELAARAGTAQPHPLRLLNGLA